MVTLTKQSSSVKTYWVKMTLLVLTGIIPLAELLVPSEHVKAIWIVRSLRTQISMPIARIPRHRQMSALQMGFLALLNIVVLLLPALQLPPTSIVNLFKKWKGQLRQRASMLSQITRSEQSKTEQLIEMTTLPSAIINQILP